MSAVAGGFESWEARFGKRNPSPRQLIYSFASFSDFHCGVQNSGVSVLYTFPRSVSHGVEVRGILFCLTVGGKKT